MTKFLGKIVEWVSKGDPSNLLEIRLKKWGEGGFPV